MTRKEVKEIIDANPGKTLYIARGIDAFIGFHYPASKTKIIRNAKLFHSVRVSTFAEERPDLDPNRYSGGDQQIVTFDARIFEEKYSEGEK